MLSIDEEDPETRLSIRMRKSELDKIKSKADLAGMSVSSFVRARCIDGQESFCLAHLPGQPAPDVKKYLQTLIDNENRTVQKRLRVTPYEDRQIKSAAQKANMTQSRYMLERIINGRIVFLGDENFFNKFFTELNRQGTNLNQIAYAMNTIALIGDMPGINPVRLQELFDDVHSLTNEYKQPLIDAVNATRRLMDALRTQTEKEANAYGDA